MDSYLLIKTVHILSATVLFGTGLGIAFFFWSARRGDDAARLFAAQVTVAADFLFTLPAVIFQPLTGGWLIWEVGYDPAELWLALSYGLYILAALCWIPVVWLQVRMRNMLEEKAAAGTFDQAAYDRLRRRWFLLGWPAFLSLLLVFWLMVAKPNW